MLVNSLKGGNSLIDFSISYLDLLIFPYRDVFSILESVLKGMLFKFSEGPLGEKNPLLGERLLRMIMPLFLVVFPILMFTIFFPVLSLDVFYELYLLELSKGGLYSTSEHAFSNLNFFIYLFP